jgi:hypothetical protein
MEKRVWGQLVQLDPINKKQVKKEFVDRNNKVASEEVDESYLESNGRMRKALISGHLQGLLLQQAHLLQRLLVLSGDLRPLPARNLDLLRGLVGAWSLVLALLRARSHGEQFSGRTGRERASARGARGMAMAEREKEQMCGVAKGMNEEDTVNL